MALWSIWSAPLLMSNDLRAISDEHRAILQNRHVIAVDQDELGIMGKRIFNASETDIWSKPMMPVLNGTHSYAIVYFNRRTLGAPVYVSNLSQCLELKLPGANYAICVLFSVYACYMCVFLTSDATREAAAPSLSLMFVVVFQVG